MYTTIVVKIIRNINTYCKAQYNNIDGLKNK